MGDEKNPITATPGPVAYVSAYFFRWDGDWNLLGAMNYAPHMDPRDISYLNWWNWDLEEELLVLSLRVVASARWERHIGPLPPKESHSPCHPNANEYSEVWVAYDTAH